jgi:hypothetical protein
MDARSTVVQYAQRRGGGWGWTDSGEKRTGLLCPVAGGEFGDKSVTRQNMKRKREFLLSKSSRLVNLKTKRKQVY